MAHMTKLKLNQVAPLHRHNTREMQATRERENINEMRTHLNFCVGEIEREEDWQQHLHDCIELHNSNGRNLRSDAVVAVSWVITQPKDFPRSRTQEFFEASHKFLEERYGANHVDVGYVHLDETTPHMHTQIDALNDETGRLQARDLFTRADLKTFHSDFEEFLCQELRIERVGVELSQEERITREMENTDMPMYKAVKQEQEQIQEEITQAHERLGEIQQDQMTAEDDLSMAYDRLEYLRHCCEHEHTGIKSTERQIEERTAEIEQCQEQTREIEREIDRREEARIEAEQLQKAVEREIEREQAEIERTEREIEQEEQRTIEEHQRSLTESVRTLWETRDDRSREQELTREAEELTRDCEELEREEIELERDCEQLAEEEITLERDCDGLEREFDDLEREYSEQEELSYALDREYERTIDQLEIARDRIAERISETIEQLREVVIEPIEDVIERVVDFLEEKLEPIKEEIVEHWNWEHEYDMEEEMTVHERLSPSALCEYATQKAEYANLEREELEQEREYERFYEHEITRGMSR